MGTMWLAARDAAGHARREGLRMAWQIIGHDWAVALLRRGVETGHVAHAYLFTGPPQIGKTRLALTLAQALNCTAADPPCGRCASCLKLEKGTHPDVRLVEGEGTSGSIKIDQIRALQREAALTPYEGRYRVFVLRRMDLATIEAANSLLKTLEEPPSHVVLVMTVVDAEALPATVVSRCQRMDLRLVPGQVVQAALRERGLSSTQAELLARLSGGRLGWAIEASSDGAILHLRQQDMDQMLDLLAADRVERIEFALDAGREPAVAQRLIASWIGWWRDMLLLLNRGQEHIVNIDRLDELKALSDQADWHQAWAALRALQTAQIRLEANVNARLAMEGLLLRLPRWVTR
jgi:DNA polymerase-3 subunit delta'